MKKIFEGFKNRLAPSSAKREDIEKMAAERLQICRQCPSNSTNNGYQGLRCDEHCTICGCNLAAKTRSPSSKCPIGKWGKARSV